MLLLLLTTGSTEVQNELLVPWWAESEWIQCGRAVVWGNLWVCMEDLVCVNGVAQGCCRVVEKWLLQLGRRSQGSSSV